MDTRIKTPFNCIVSGASGTGKTTFVFNMLYLRDVLFTKVPERIFVYYKYNQNIYREMLRRKIINELIPITNDINYEDIVEKVSPYAKGNGSLIVIDDAMLMISNDFEQLFTNLSHHQNCSVIFLTQNLFYKDKTYRTMSLNTHYFVIMKNPRDYQQLQALARQICPGNTTYVTKSYKDATKSSYRYLFLDFKPDSPSSLRLRTNLFPHEFPYMVYMETGY